MVSPNPEKAHKPPRSPQDLYIVRFWVLLPRVSLVWDVTLKRASPRAHSGSSLASVSREEKKTISHSLGEVSDLINPPGSHESPPLLLLELEAMGQRPLAAPARESEHQWTPEPQLLSNWPRSTSCSTPAGIRPPE